MFVEDNYWQKRRGICVLPSGPYFTAPRNQRLQRDAQCRGPRKNKPTATDNMPIKLRKGKSINFPGYITEDLWTLQWMRKSNLPCLLWRAIPAEHKKWTVRPSLHHADLEFPEVQNNRRKWYSLSRGPLCRCRQILSIIQFLSSRKFHMWRCSRQCS
jgi:hypothetical protein